MEKPHTSSRLYIRKLFSYSAALLIVFIACMVRWSLPGALGSTPFLAFYPAVVATAALGGFGPGVLATIISWLCVAVFFDATPGRIGLSDPAEAGRLLIFLTGGFGVSLMAELQQRGSRRLAQQTRELHESEMKYRHIVETAQEGIWMIDRDNRIVFANQKAADILGYTIRDLIGRSPYEFMALESRDAAQKQFLDHHRGVCEVFDFRFVRKDGADLWCILSTTAFFDDQEQFNGSLVMITEITARKQAEEALQELNTALAQRVADRTAELVRRKEQLRALAGELINAEQRERTRLAKVLHDHLQQLLVAAKYQLAVLGRMGSETVQPAVTKATSLIDDSIAASRSLTAELSPPMLQDAGLCAGLQWLAKRMHERHGLLVELEQEQDEELPGDIRVLLFESVRELLFNVVKHAHTQAARVRLQRNDGRLQVVVSDQGHGFDSTIVSAAEGRKGFGLFSIRERLALMGGTFEITSVPGQGSRFLLSLPIEKNEQRIKESIHA
jgi:PAS domain S-box-containing protein